MSEIHCPSCRHANEAGAVFCGACGARLAPTAPQPAPQAPQFQSAPMPPQPQQYGAPVPPAPQYGAPQPPQYGAQPQYQAPGYQQQVPPGYGAPGYPYGAQPMPGMQAGYVPAGVGVRFLALFIDGILLSVVQYLIGPGALYFLISLAYVIVMWVMQGATLGKMALGLRVVSVDGQPLSWGRAALRYVLYFLSFTALFDSQKRGLHDKVAKTMVVKKA